MGFTKRRQKLPEFMIKIRAMKVEVGETTKLRLLHPISWIIVPVALMVGVVDVMHGRETPGSIYGMIRENSVFW